MLSVFRQFHHKTSGLVVLTFQSLSLSLSPTPQFCTALRQIDSSLTFLIAGGPDSKVLQKREQRGLKI